MAGDTSLSAPHVPISTSSYPHTPAFLCPSCLNLPISLCLHFPASPCHHLPDCLCPCLHMSLCPLVPISSPRVPISPCPSPPVSLCPMSSYPDVPVSSCPHVSICLCPCPHDFTSTSPRVPTPPLPHALVPELTRDVQHQPLGGMAALGGRGLSDAMGGVCLARWAGLAWESARAEGRCLPRDGAGPPGGGGAERRAGPGWAR